VIVDGTTAKVGYKRSKSRSVPQGKIGKSEMDDRVWRSRFLIDHERVREVDRTTRIAMRDWLRQ
jgi:hypothetical protein